MTEDQRQSAIRSQDKFIDALSMQIEWAKDQVKSYRKELKQAQKVRAALGELDVTKEHQTAIPGFE